MDGHTSVITFQRFEYEADATRYGPGQSSFDGKRDYRTLRSKAAFPVQSLVNSKGAQYSGTP